MSKQQFKAKLWLSSIEVALRFHGLRAYFVLGHDLINAQLNYILRCIFY